MTHGNSHVSRRFSSRLGRKDRMDAVSQVERNTNQPIHTPSKLLVRGWAEKCIREAAPTQLLMIKVLVLGAARVAVRRPLKAMVWTVV